MMTDGPRCSCPEQHEGDCCHCYRGCCNGTVQQQVQRIEQRVMNLETGVQTLHVNVGRIRDFLDGLKPLVDMASSYVNGSAKDKVKAVLRRG